VLLPPGVLEVEVMQEAHEREDQHAFREQKYRADHRPMADQPHTGLEPPLLVLQELGDDQRVTFPRRNRPSEDAFDGLQELFVGEFGGTTPLEQTCAQPSTNEAPDLGD